MSHDPPRTAREIFEELADRPAQQRPALLCAACRGDEVLRDRVLKLLRADQGAGDFLETPAILSADSAEDLPPPIPRRIGRYQVNGLIATGGMGTVYEAQQERPRRTVALKVMRWSIASPSAQRRFEYESELLARLQ
ncbi:MAG: serine/threonine protein kinase, partial [bacterium]|nr:serine/threonine protein kinase [bacterium]